MVSMGTTTFKTSMLFPKEIFRLPTLLVGLSLPIIHG